MKTYLSLFMALCSCLAFGQKHNAITYPEDDQPGSVKVDVAFNEAKNTLATAGFTSAYISSEDIRELLEINNCTGIRFYIAMELPVQKFSDIIAVAIDGEGKELGRFLSRKYHMAKCLDTHFPDDYRKMGRQGARKLVNNLINGRSGIKRYCSYLGKTNFQKLMATANTTGVRIYSAVFTVGDDSYTTMAFGSVKEDKGILTDVGTHYLESQLPCPVQCGDQPPALWPQ